MQLNRILEKIEIRVQDGYEYFKFPFHSATWRGDLEEVKQHHKRDEHAIDMRDDNGCTALHVAAYRNDVSIAEYLCANEVSLFQKDGNGDNGLTPVSYAVIRDSNEFMNMVFSLDESILEKHKIFARDYRGRDPFQMAVICDSWKVLERLIAENKEISSYDYRPKDLDEIGNPYNLLQIAAIKNSAQCAEVLIQNKVDFRSVGDDERGRMPVDLANEHDSVDVRNVLIDAMRSAAKKSLRSADFFDNLRVKAKMNMIEVLGNQYVDSREASEHTGKTIVEINKWLEDDDNSSANRLTLNESFLPWLSKMGASALIWAWYLFSGSFMFLIFSQFWKWMFGIE